MYIHVLAGLLAHSPLGLLFILVLYEGFGEARHLLAVEYLSVLVVLSNRLIPGQRDCCFMIVWSFHGWLVFTSAGFC